jgi:hypothetical protein
MQDIPERGICTGEFKASGFGISGQSVLAFFWFSTKQPQLRTLSKLIAALLMSRYEECLDELIGGALWLRELF